MLVDPLAAFFKPALQGRTPLVLDAAHVEVALLPPLARVAITRSFTNRSDDRIEAVLTLPPVAPGEVVYGLTVTLGGVAYDAVARSRRAGARAYDAAVEEGRRAILHELAAGDVQVISIAGIDPGMRVVVRIDSVQPLHRPADGSSALYVALTADPGPVNRRLSDADALLTTRERHAATLWVSGHGLEVMVSGHDGPLVPDQTTPIDCEAVIALHITAQPGRSLERTNAPGAWEVFCASDPVDVVLAGRDEVIGRCLVGGRTIQAVAPSRLGVGERPGPDARAVTAFAAAHVVNISGSGNRASLRRTAGILDRATNLVFVGPEGELGDQMPTLRKVALPGPAPTAVTPVPAPPALEPFPTEPPPRDPGPALPEPDHRFTPGQSGPKAPHDAWPTLGWAILDWSPLGFVALWLLGATVWVPTNLLPATIGFAAVSLINAVRHFPRRQTPEQAGARRRLPLLLILALPPLFSMIASPLGPLSQDIDAATTDLVIHFQGVCIAAAAALPLILLFALRGGRRFTLYVGGLAFLAAFLSVSVAVITLLPES